MSKSLTFIVTLSFTEKVTDDNEIMEVAKNIADAIKVQVDGYGIAPEDNEAFTAKINVKPQFLDETVEIVLYEDKGYMYEKVIS